MTRFTTTIAKEVSKLTDYNCHTEARIKIAEHFGFDNYKKIFETILDEQESLGYITETMYEIRKALTNDMMMKIKEGEKLVKESYQGVEHEYTVKEYEEIQMAI